MLRALLVLVWVSSLGSLAVGQNIAKDRIPNDEAKSNVVLIFADDLGYGDLSCYGHPTIRTPHLDQMAREGMRFTQFYSASPVCTSSRYSLLTGRLPIRSGFASVLWPKSERGIHADEITIAEALKSEGFATAIFGKWHLGVGEAHLPLAHGFDEYVGLPYSNDMRVAGAPDLPLMEGNEVLEFNPDQSKLTRLYTDRAIDFIDRKRDQNFFVYLPYTMPHLPLHPGEDFAGKSARGKYGDVVEEIDFHVGRILSFLREEGLAENTMVIFTSDNGPWTSKGAEGGSAGLLRGGKSSTWEGGVRVPAIFWQPGYVEADAVERQLASTLDILPTVVWDAGKGIRETRRLDGKYLMIDQVSREFAFMADEFSSSGPHGPFKRTLYFYGPSELHAVRSGPWKLHVKTSGPAGEDDFGDKLPLLFHLDRDPSEQYDLAGKHPEVVKELLALIKEHQADIAAHPNDWDKAGED